MTLRGIGTRVLNCSISDSDGTCYGYKWFTFLYLPLFPLFKIRFIRKITSRHIFETVTLEKFPMTLREILRVYLKGWFVYPVLLFWPFIFLISEVYERLEVSFEYYKYLLIAAISYSVAIVWVLISRYELTGLPKDYKQRLRKTI